MAPVVPSPTMKIGTRSVNVWVSIPPRSKPPSIAPNIPSMIHRRWKPCFSPVRYRARNRIERFFNRIKYFRRLATRYEKHAANFLAMLKLAAEPENSGCAAESVT